MINMGVFAIQRAAELFLVKISLKKTENRVGFNYSHYDLLYIIW